MWKRLGIWSGRHARLAALVSALAYVSTAEAGLSADQIAALGERSRLRNASDGITGILIYNGRNFFQILEGDREPLYGLLRRLSLDQRHVGLSLVYEQHNTPRVFGDWGLRTWHSRGLREVARELPKTLDPHLAGLARAFARLG